MKILISLRLDSNQENKWSLKTVSYCKVTWAWLGALAVYFYISGRGDNRDDAGDEDH